MLRACEDVRREIGGYVSISSVAREAVHRKAGSFYLSEGRYLEIIKGHRGIPASPLKRAMHADIRNIAAGLRMACPGITLRETVAIIAAQEAPRFYLSAKRATDIIYGAMKKR
ncbi:MAG: hypothetical protein LBK22_06050 [Tannerella sp.]|nr:hypothetical protein [Tannerella sp.]